MKNKYYLLLNRFTNLEIDKEYIKEYLEECDEDGIEPSPVDFLDYIGSYFSFDNFLEKVEDTDIEDDTQFYQLIKEIKEND